MTEVSVIIPTRNRSKLLELSLRSVLWQRSVDFETIVVDDGSTDDTPRMLRSLGDRIRVFRHERSQGVSAARNRGIAEARGEWVAFLDDDDLWAPDKLELQLQALRRDDRRWAYAGAVEITVARSVDIPRNGARSISCDVIRCTAVCVLPDTSRGSLPVSASYTSTPSE